MHLVQIDRLRVSVPTALDTRHRSRLDTYVRTAQQCERRIQQLRRELEQALKGGEGGRASNGGDEPAQPVDVLAIVSELHTLEGVQPRVDGWLKQYVASLANQHTADGYSDAEVYGDGGPM